MTDVGRPSVFTEDVCRKIEEVAALDGSVEEMAFYAGIHRTSIYNYFKENPEFFDKIQTLRERPVLLARQTIIKSLSDPNHAFRYVERKRPKEWAPTNKLEHSGEVDTKIPAEQLSSAAADSLRERYELELRQTIVTGTVVGKKPELLLDVGIVPIESSVPLTVKSTEV